MNHQREGNAPKLLVFTLRHWIIGHWWHSGLLSIN